MYRAGSGFCSEEAIVDDCSLADGKEANEAADAWARVSVRTSFAAANLRIIPLSGDEVSPGTRALEVCFLYIKASRSLRLSYISR